MRNSWRSFTVILNNAFVTYTSFLNVVGYRSLNLTSRKSTKGRCTMVCYVAGHKYLLNSIYFNTLFLVTDLLCPPVWDHVMCWNSTEAGTTALQPCPNYIHRFLLNGNRYLFSKITFMKFQQICLKGQKDHLCRLALVFTTVINVQFSERAIKKLPFLALTRPRGKWIIVS